ncbi:MAG: glycosyltransferase family 2 protein [Acidobacteriaceae bacterium]
MIASVLELGGKGQLTVEDVAVSPTACSARSAMPAPARASALTRSTRSITVIFPAYNEEQNIRSAIARAVDAMRPRFLVFELLIIDDGSTDRTGEIAEDLAKEHPEITVIHNRKNLGLGETLYLGFQRAQGELVIQNAMDYPLDLRDLDKMIPLLEKADVVVAVRKGYAGYTPYRKLASRVNRFILRQLFNPKLRDYNYTQLFKREVLGAARPNSRSTVFMVPEIIIRAYELGFKFVELDIGYQPRLFGKATSGRPKVVLRSLRDMFKFWIEHSLHIGEAPAVEQEI